MNAQARLFVKDSSLQNNDNNQRMLLRHLITANYHVLASFVIICCYGVKDIKEEEEDL